MKKNNMIRWIIFLVLFSWAIYSLIPTYSIYFSKEKDDIVGIELKSQILNIKQKVKSGVDLTEVEKKQLLKYGEKEGYQNSLTKIEKVKKADYEKNLSKSLALGLDLQGGMHLVLEINYNKMLTKMSKIKTKKFEDLLLEVDNKVGYDKENYFSTLQEVFKGKLKLSDCFGKTDKTDKDIAVGLDSTAKKAIKTTLEVLRNRIDQFGISEPSIQKRGDYRIVVELPGVKDEERATKLVKQAAFLEFKIVAGNDTYEKIFNSLDLVMKKQNGDADTTTIAEVKTTNTLEAKDSNAPKDVMDLVEGKTVKVDSSKAEDAVKPVVEKDFSKEHPFKSLLISGRGGEIFVSEENRNILGEFFNSDEAKLALGQYQVVWKSKPMINNKNEKYYEIMLVNKKVELDGTTITQANAALASGGSATGGWEVNLEFNRIGAKGFAAVTGRNVGKRLAIILDNKLYMAPNIKVKISNGRAQITGGFASKEARDLAIVLKSGALDAPIDIIEKRIIGPSLGADSIRSGLMAAVIGISLVMIFMIIWYKLSGVFSVIALLLNLIFLMATLAYFRATLTLPGIAGIILTVGMAVDANVLIFERVKEELRDKKTIYSAVNAGYERAFNTIFDANITTFIAGIVLYQFGTGAIKGFALTLMIGILWSMYTAVVITRLLTNFYINKNSKKISI